MCYSVNRYKPLQNQLLHKPLQTVTNRYKTSYSVNRYKLFQNQSDFTAQPLAQSRHICEMTFETFAQWLLDINLDLYELLS